MEWKQIDGTKYFASRCGKIMKNGVILPQKPNQDGYLKITKKYPYLVHRLIAAAFVDNPMGKPEVNHKDGDKQNNNADNLEWCTNQENIKHAISMGRHIAKLNDEIAFKIRSLSASGLTMKEIANIYSIGTTTVFNIIHRKTWK